MKSALIGHSGFVGGNLARQFAFDDFFNSKNIEALAGQRYDLVVCAGAPAAKWLANKDPEGDRRSIDRLIDALVRVDAREVVLVSTIDVYPVTRGADESENCDAKPNHAYGANRLLLERAVQDRFGDALVVRLPALFGDGLKKNVIFDLLHDNCLDAIQPASTFQWYGLDRLWSDLTIARDARLGLVNLFTEPLETSSILERFFPEKVVGASAGPAIHYALTTRHDRLFGGENGYVADRSAVLDSMAVYLARARAEKPA